MLQVIHNKQAERQRKQVMEASNKNKTRGVVAAVIANSHFHLQECIRMRIDGVTYEDWCFAFGATGVEVSVSLNAETLKSEVSVFYEDGQDALASAPEKQRGSGDVLACVFACINSVDPAMLAHLRIDSLLNA